MSQKQNITIGPIAATSISLGAIATPAAAQSYTPPPQPQNQIQQQQPNNGPSGCGELVVAGGVALAIGAAVKNRSKSGTQRQLGDDLEEGRAWHYNRGRGRDY